MITEVENPPMESATSIVSGIVDDFRDLVKQEFHLAHQELREDFRKTREASLLWGTGVGMIFLSAIAFVLMLANGLHTLTSPAGTDPASLPLWGCYAIVSVLLAILGVAVAIVGQNRFDSISLLANQFNRVTKEAPNGRQS